MLFQWHRGICIGLRGWVKREIPPSAFQQVSSPFETVKNLTIAMSSNDAKKFAGIQGKEFHDELGEMMFPSGQPAFESSATSDGGATDLNASDPMRDVIFDDSFFMNLLWSFPNGPVMM